MKKKEKKKKKKTNKKKKKGEKKKVRKESRQDRHSWEGAVEEEKFPHPVNSPYKKGH